MEHLALKPMVCWHRGKIVLANPLVALRILRRGRGECLLLRLALGHLSLVFFTSYWGVFFQATAMGPLKCKVAIS